ncbi:Uncharacterised protein [Kluyvera cryocrescens]|uniref:LysR substrate binding domain n=1 Tax=Kluyvera cryocrescens TaxID=580 RepID=A0A485B6B7_KLUCR|nr:Uncharacterised protein [Kluyvera cryocrescens]
MRGRCFGLSVSVTLPFLTIRGIFSVARGYAPTCIEEPLEHDILLARIARGDGLSLFPASFSAIQRQGVVFRPLRDETLSVGLGLVMPAENEGRLGWLAESFKPTRA